MCRYNSGAPPEGPIGNYDPEPILIGWLPVRNLMAVAGEQVDSRDFISAAEVQRRLGVAEGTLHRLINDGELTAYWIGSRIRVRLVDLDAYLESARIQPGSLGAWVIRRGIKAPVKPVLIKPTMTTVRRPTRIRTVGEDTTPSAS